jgi:peroxiredoxin/outer membrane lipoprotein-sorting protein
MLALIAASLVAQTGPVDAENAYKALELRIAKLRSVEGDLITWNGAATIRKIHFEIARPNLYRVEISSKDGSALDLGDGTADWYLSRPENTYQKHPAQPDRTRIGYLTGFEQFDSPDEIYYEFKSLAHEPFDGKPSTCLVMNFPSSPDAAIKLYLDDRTGWPLGFRFRTGKGSDLTIRYSNLKFDAPIKRSNFVFRLPSDATPFAMPAFDLRGDLLANGTAAPDFTLSTVSGRPMRLSDLIKGKKALVLDFWFRDCPPCRLELSHIKSAYREFRKNGIEFLAVDCADSPETVAQFIKQQGFSFPVVMDTAGKGSMNGVYGVKAFPTTYVIGRDGKIAASFVGFDEGALAKVLQSIESRP